MASKNISSINNHFAAQVSNRANNSISMLELKRIKSSIKSTKQGQMNPTELIMLVKRLNSDQRGTPEGVQSLVTDYIANKGKSSLNKWQIAGVVRAVLASKTIVTHADLSNVELEVMRKETGLPGTKQYNRNTLSNSNTNKRGMSLRTTNQTPT